MSDEIPGMTLSLDLSHKSADYIMGMEAGKIWNMLSSAMYDELAGACHVVNKSIVEGIGLTHGWVVAFTDADDGVWSEYVATRSDKPGKPKLRVIQ